MAVETKKRLLTTSKAISEGIAQEMERDSTVFVMGEDVGIDGAPAADYLTEVVKLLEEPAPLLATNVRE